ncbi:hypothetical protein F2P81_008270 [Scophthalmus maximus]|uniref:Uncharacterized protein n=1 Tax=Scophthalmus maximus TaxID=52904 RepID=A0A6A4T4I4_SCOMX|nr:hypothetical protein F2P81_008270 [Scophthalmus maximus]
MLTAQDNSSGHHLNAHVDWKQHGAAHRNTNIGATTLPLPRLLHERSQEGEVQRHCVSTEEGKKKDPRRRDTRRPRPPPDAAVRGPATSKRRKRKRSTSSCTES